jgi:hypothetical protein
VNDADHLPLGGEPDLRYQRLRLHNRVHTWLIGVWFAVTLLTDFFNYAEYETRGCFVAVVVYSYIALWTGRWEWERIKQRQHAHAAEHYLGHLSGQRQVGHA